MKLPPLPLIDGCLFVDNSMLELLTTCPRALQYNKLNQRISAAIKPSLNFGGAMHLALEYRYKIYRALAPDPYCEDDQLKLLTKVFDEKPPPIDDWRNLNWAVEVNRRYNQRYQLEPFNLLKYETPVKCSYCDGKGEHGGILCLMCQGTGKNEMMIELPFTLKLYTYHCTRVLGHIPEYVDVMYSGRIDLPALMDDMLFIIDHKTTGLLGKTFFERAAMMAQQLGYCWSFQELTKRRVNGYMVNAIRTKEPPLWVNDTEKKSRSGQRPEAWWDESFQRERFYVTPTQLEEWRDNTIELVNEFFWHYERDYMPMKTSWCTQFGRCPYYDVCTLPMEQRHMMLDSNIYTHNEWSPLIEPSDSIQ